MNHVVAHLTPFYTNILFIKMFRIIDQLTPKTNCTNVFKFLLARAYSSERTNRTRQQNLTIDLYCEYYFNLGVVDSTLTDFGKQLQLIFHSANYIIAIKFATHLYFYFACIEIK